MDLKFNLNLLTKYRLELMGISAILIILCHSVVEGVKMPLILSYLLSLGNAGVDIFLFLSGMNMYFSLKKKWKKFNRLVQNTLLTNSCTIFDNINTLVDIFFKWIVGFLTKHIYSKLLGYT